MSSPYVMECLLCSAAVKCLCEYHRMHEEQAHGYCMSRDEYLPNNTTKSQKQRVYKNTDDVYNSPHTDSYFRIYDEQPKQSSSRRYSNSNRIPLNSAKLAYMQSPRKATEADAERAGIPSGYSIKNWDPDEASVIILDSIFDANSLGKWIFDWAVFQYGASGAIADMAGDLWLLLIKLTGKIKRAQTIVDDVYYIDNHEMMEGFRASGSQLWQNFKELLKDCEKHVWRVAVREGSIDMLKGKNAGIEFINSIFGRDRELENTEAVMASIRLWNLRFDNNCEDMSR